MIEVLRVKEMGDIKKETKNKPVVWRVSSGQKTERSVGRQGLKAIRRCLEGGLSLVQFKDNKMDY